MTGNAVHASDEGPVTGSATRTRRRRKDARPAEIIEAGLAEFAANGYSGARLIDVAARAGVAKGTIYRYFDKKQALFEAAVRSRVVRVFDEVVDLLPSLTGSTEALIREMMKNIYSAFRKEDIRILMRIVISEGDRHPELMAFYHREIVSRGQRLISQLLEQGIQSGEFRNTPAATMPLVIIAPLIATMVWRMTFERFDPLNVDDAYEAHMDLLFSGLRSVDS